MFMGPKAIEIAIEDCMQLYQRESDLPYLIAVWPRELKDYSVGGTEYIIERIHKVVRAHYRAALQGHWSYGDGNRLIALRAALGAEKARLEHLKSAQGEAA